MPAQAGRARKEGRGRVLGWGGRAPSHLSREDPCPQTVPHTSPHWARRLPTHGLGASEPHRPVAAQV